MQFADLYLKRRKNRHVRNKRSKLYKPLQLTDQEKGVRLLIRMHRLRLQTMGYHQEQT
jgi:hypothetical protein